MYVSLCVCLPVCSHDKTKMVETKIAKLGTGIVTHDALTHQFKGQRSRSQDQKVQKVATRQPFGAISLYCVATQLDCAARPVCVVRSIKCLTYSSLTVHYLFKAGQLLP